MPIDSVENFMMLMPNFKSKVKLATAVIDMIMLHTVRYVRDTAVTAGRVLGSFVGENSVIVSSSSTISLIKNARTKLFAPFPKLTILVGQAKAKRKHNITVEQFIEHTNT